MNPRSRKLHLLRCLPRSLMLTEYPAGARRLYLSFDDGPHPECTPRILDLLAEHDAHASFFLLGKHVERYPDLVRRMVDEGHLIGNHSYSHPTFTKIPLTEQSAEIDRTDRLLMPFDGRALHRFRPPSGAVPLNLLLDFSRKRRCIAYWSYDSMDYRRRPAVELADSVRSAPPRDGDIILMHDDDMNTLYALEKLLPEWKAAGFSLAAMPEESP